MNGFAITYVLGDNSRQSTVIYQCSTYFPGRILKPPVGTISSCCIRGKEDNAYNCVVYELCEYP
jgi:hypothetical protein